MCDRFHCTPAEAEEMEIEAQRLITIQRIAYPERYKTDEEQGGQ